MTFKRLRSGKTINSETAAKLSFSAKEQLSEAVRAQFSETALLPEELSSSAEKINASGYSVLRIGHNFNEYCEAVSKTAVFKSSRMEICKTVFDLCEKSKAFLERKELLLLCKIPSENIFVDIDSERFCYAILDLILNAAENTPEKGTIRMTVSKTKKFAKISVCDNGYGMDEETVLHCFEPFFSKSYSRKKTKMGLGLTLVHYFAAESGGRVSVSSKPGKGTSVSVLLPLSSAKGTDLSVSAPVQEIPGGKFSPVYIMLSGIEKE